MCHDSTPPTKCLFVSQHAVHAGRMSCRAGLVGECHLFVTPMVVGGGKQSMPDYVRLKLELLDERRFGNGMVYLYYRTRNTR